MRAMTVDAHAHRERLELRDAIHRLDWAVALLAFDLSRDVAAVIESHVIGQIVNPHPFNRFIFGHGARDLLYLRRILARLRMAIHAGRSRRNARDFRPLRRRMAVEARNLVVTRVNAMREVDRLRGRVTLMVVEPTEGRALQGDEHAQHGERQRDNFGGSEVHLLTSYKLKLAASRPRPHPPAM
ncbi:MAG: hypothetical protein JMDDDDMK_03546 [Acidobacteria bacterium]|nr:hypothetical protein [Acidobacteriota bacterium]